MTLVDNHGVREPDFGAVAQLGERLNGIQEVEGSTPFRSTLCSSIEWLDAYIAELDRIAVPGKAKVALGAILAWMRSIIHEFGDRRQIRIQNNAAV